MRFAQNKYQFTASPESKWESRKVIRPGNNPHTTPKKVPTNSETSNTKPHEVTNNPEAKQEQSLAIEYKPFPEKLPDQERFTVSVQPNEAFKFPEAGRD